MEYKTPDDIKKQIDNSLEHADAAIREANTAINELINAIYDITRTRKENATTLIERDEPDSEGFWRDIDDDIWVRDRDGNVRLIARGYRPYKDDNMEIYDLSFTYGTKGYGPFTKINNPFTEREDHAD